MAKKSKLKQDRSSKKEELEQEIYLHDPHPGIGGALAPLPNQIKEIADDLDGTVTTLHKAMKRFSPAAAKLCGRLECIESKKYEKNMITFEYQTNDGCTHCYSLIYYDYVIS